MHDACRALGPQQCNVPTPLVVPGLASHQCPSQVPLFTCPLLQAVHGYTRNVASSIIQTSSRCTYAALDGTLTMLWTQQLSHSRLLLGILQNHQLSLQPFQLQNCSVDNILFRLVLLECADVVTMFEELGF